MSEMSKNACKFKGASAMPRRWCADGFVGIVSLVLLLFSPAVTYATPVDVPTGSTVKLSDYGLSADFTLSGGTLQLDQTSGSAEYTGTVTGAGIIEKTGSGILTFNGGRTLTSDTTIKVSNGRLRFKDFAEAGGAKLYGNGGQIANAPGYAITIPDTTDVRSAASALNFYVEGVGTNIVLQNCNHLNQRVMVYGDSFASVIKFAGDVQTAAVGSYLDVRSGTAMLANPSSGIYINYVSGMGGGFMFGTPTSKIYNELSFQIGHIDAGGNNAQVNIFRTKDACADPEHVVLTNSAPPDASLTVSTIDQNRTVLFRARDGEAGRFTLHYDYNDSKGKYDLGNALFSNKGLTISKGEILSTERSSSYNGKTWWTTASASGRYLRLIVTRNLDNKVDNGLLRVGEFRLTRAGSPIAWPAGTTATSPNPSVDEGGGVVCSPQLMIDGDMGTYWRPNQFVSANPPAVGKPATNIIDMTREVSFNGYQIATGGDRRDLAPRYWTLDVGRMVNGEIVWERISDIYPNKTINVYGDIGNMGYYDLMYWSRNEYYANIVFPLEPAQGARSWPGPQFQNTDFALEVAAPGVFSVSGHSDGVHMLSGDGTINLNNAELFADTAVDFTGMINAGTSGRFGGDPTMNGTLCVGDGQATSVVATDAVGDDVLLNLGAAGRFVLAHASEMVGGLSGTGTVDFGGDGVLTLGNDVPTMFHGTFLNGGTVVLSAGTFSGLVTADGDYVMRGAGGAWKGTIAVSGKLTLEGNLRFSTENLPEGRHVLATFGSLGAGSADAIAAAAVDPAPSKPLLAEVVVEGNSLVMYIAPKGFILILR